MQPSHVSGGFWLQFPSELVHLLPSSKTMVWLYCPTPTWGTQYETADGGRWPCTWLPRSKGAGLSGGWRGFAIDQQLLPFDQVRLIASGVSMC